MLESVQSGDLVFQVSEGRSVVRMEGPALPQEVVHILWHWAHHGQSVGWDFVVVHHLRGRGAVDVCSQETRKTH